MKGITISNHEQNHPCFFLFLFFFVVVVVLVVFIVVFFVLFCFVVFFCLAKTPDYQWNKCLFNTLILHPIVLFHWRLKTIISLLYFQEYWRWLHQFSFPSGLYGGASDYYPGKILLSTLYVLKQHLNNVDLNLKQSWWRYDAICFHWLRVMLLRICWRTWTVSHL